MEEHTMSCTHTPNGDFNHCCIEHDSYYEDGSISRLESDNKLFKCIINKPDRFILNQAWHFIVASVYWFGVRIFGKSKYSEKRS